MNPPNSAFHPVPTAPRPLDPSAEMTLKEMSRQVAVEGIHARHAAQAEGADPRQIEAVIGEAARTAPAGAVPKVPVNGIMFHRMTLAVTLGYRRATSLMERCAEQIDEIAQIAIMAAVLHDPVGSRKLDLDGLIEAGLALIGDWQAPEIDDFRAYLEALAPRDAQAA